MAETGRSPIPGYEEVVMRVITENDLNVVSGGDLLTPDQGAAAELALAGVAASVGLIPLAVLAVGAAVDCWAIGNASK